MSYLYPRLAVKNKNNGSNENNTKEYDEVNTVCTNDNTQRIITFVTDRDHTHTIQHGPNPELNYIILKN